jgi:hypothetical protein
MLHVAHAIEAGDVPSVFASRHGDCHGAVDIMTTLANRALVTANAFSHSVHNTAAGLHAIVAGNPEASSSIAGGAESFAAAMIEACGLLHRTAAGRVLVVVADAPVPELFARFTSEPSAPYAVALLLVRDHAGETVRIDPGGDEAERPPWPDAVEFLRWLLSTEPATVIGRGRLPLCCRRER